jgi:hypothetical protein
MMQDILFDRDRRDESKGIRLGGDTSRVTNCRLIYLVLDLPEEFSSFQFLIDDVDHYETYAIEYSSSS